MKNTNNTHKKMARHTDNSQKKYKMFDLTRDQEIAN